MKKITSDLICVKTAVFLSSSAKTLDVGFISETMRVTSLKLCTHVTSVEHYSHFSDIYLTLVSQKHQKVKTTSCDLSKFLSSQV